MKLYGVFVGVDKYQDERIRNLNYACSDAIALYELMKNSLDPAECSLRLMTDAEATKDAVIEAIGEDLSRVVTEDDMVVLYFSGHGAPEFDNSADKTSRYLVMHDTQFSKVFTSGIDMEETIPRICFKRLRARLILLIVDTCFSGLVGGRTFKGPELAKQGVRGIHLDQLNLGEGRLVMTACADDELAQENSELGHGVFTYYLLDTLSQNKGAQQTVSIAQLYDTVSEKVFEYTKENQHPTLNGNSKLAKLPLFPTSGKA